MMDQPRIVTRPESFHSWAEGFHSWMEGFLAPAGETTHANILAKPQSRFEM